MIFIRLFVKNVMGCKGENMYIKHNGKVYGVKSKKYIYTFFFDTFNRSIVISVFRIPKNHKSIDFSRVCDRFDISDMVLDRIHEKDFSINAISQQHPITKGVLLTFVKALVKESGL